MSEFDREIDDLMKALIDSGCIRSDAHRDEAQKLAKKCIQLGMASMVAYAALNPALAYDWIKKFRSE